jgi:hypothetical protein
VEGSALGGFSPASAFFTSQWWVVGEAGRAMRYSRAPATPSGNSALAAVRTLPIDLDDPFAELLHQGRVGLTEGADE